MLGIFPEPYKDELIYSVLARYCVRSGYAKYVFVAEDLFVKKTAKPSFEYFSSIKSEVVAELSKDRSFQEMIYDHTMFPYHCRFLPKERKQEALDALINMDTNYRNLVLFPKRQTTLAMRYCPLCVANDRDTYGETYWHRLHQIIEMSVCPLHHCYLVDTKYKLSGKLPPDLTPAEIVIPFSESTEKCSNAVENRLADYIRSVFDLPIKMDEECLVDKIIKHKTKDTMYRSPRGEICRITALYKDFVNFYCGVINDLPKQWQIHKILTGQRYDFWEVCLLCFFLNISINELEDVVKEERESQEIFDDKIAELHNKGYSYPKIAELMGCSVDIIKNAAYSKSKQIKPRKRKGGKPGRRQFDWQAMDRDMLPKVVETIAELKSSEKPQRITLGGVASIVGLKSKQIEKLPLCKATIMQDAQTQEMYWAQKVVWAWSIISREGRSKSVKQVRLITNMGTDQIRRCMSDLEKINIEVFTEISKIIRNEDEK